MRPQAKAVTITLSHERRPKLDLWVAPTVWAVVATIRIPHFAALSVGQADNNELTARCGE